MRDFNYSKLREQKWDSNVVGLIAAIYKYAGKQELYLKQRPDELEKLVEIAKIQAQKHPMRLKALSQQIPGSSSLSKKRQLLKTEMKKRLLDIGMS